MKKFRWLITMLLILTVSITGCADQQSSGIKPEDKAEKPVGKIRIGVMSDVGAVPFVTAKEQGFFEKRGLDVEVQIFKSAMDRDTALQTGNLDGAMSDMLSIIFFKEAGVDVKMTSNTYGNYKMITSPKLSAEKLIGMETISIGMSSNTVIDFATQKIAESKGFDARLSKVAIPQMPVRLEMLRAGELNGATLPDPLATAAVLDGGTIVGSTEEFGLYPAIFIMTQTALSDNPEGIKLMYEAYNEAVDYLNATESDVYFDFLVETLGFPPVLKGQFMMPKFEQIGAPDPETFKETSIWANDLGLSKQRYEYKDLTDISALPQ
jgi:NitT/TauT family transport system substrate-binding protein